MNAVDTNILMYLLDPTAGAKRAQARELLRATRDVVYPWQVLCELCNGLRKLEGRGLAPREGQQLVLEILGTRQVLYPTAPVLVRALGLRDRFSLSFWDANIVAACLEGGVSVLYSEDMTAYPLIDGLRLVNPFPGQGAS